MPPILLEGNRVFPIEAALFAIEIKTKLTAAEIKPSVDSAIQLRSLRYRAGEYDADGKPILSIVQSVIPAILAFDSDLSQSGKTEIQRLEEIGRRLNNVPPIQMSGIQAGWSTPIFSSRGKVVGTLVLRSRKVIRTLNASDGECR